MKHALIALTLAFVAAPVAHAQTPASCAAAEYRALDFWIGEWDVYVTGAETRAGRSTIRSEDGGCVITEHWRSVGQPYTGRSLNIYDSAIGQWTQFWVDSSGEVTRFVGGPFEGGMRLIDPANVTPRGPVHTRMTLTPNADGSVRQHGEASQDGETWVARYDFTYRRRAE